MPTTYSRAHIILHWVTVVLILQQFIFHDAISAAFRAMLRGEAVAASPAIAAHVFGGALILVFALARIAMRFDPGVPPEAEAPPAQKLTAKVVHLGLYALMILLPLSGAIAWFRGIATAGEVHEVLKVMLMVLVALHVLGALWHQFVQKDGLMTRMSLRG